MPLFFNNPAALIGMILAALFSTFLIMKHVNGAESKYAAGNQGVGSLVRRLDEYAGGGSRRDNAAASDAPAWADTRNPENSGEMP